MNKTTLMFLLAVAAWLASSSFTFAQVQGTGDEWDVLNQEAASLYRQGQYAQAEALLQRSLAIQEKALGSDHSDVGTNLNNLASVYRVQGRYDQAEVLFKRSLAIKEKTFGPNHPDVATALNNLASLYFVQGRYSQAEPIFDRSLAIRERNLGADHPDVAVVLNNLGELYRKQAQYAQAEQTYKRSLAVTEMALGLDHLNVASTLNNLATLYYIQGHYAKAEPLFKRSLEIKEKSLGLYHHDVATTLSNLGLNYSEQSQYAQAIPLYKRALEIKEKNLGSDHPDIASTLNNLALLYVSQGQFEQAEIHLNRALLMTEKVFGSNHPYVALSLNNLAYLYGTQGKYRQAEPFVNRALMIEENKLGPDHPDVAQSLNNLAYLYRAQDQYAKAELLYKQALAIMEKAYAPNHPAVALALNNLAETYRNQGNVTRAEPLYLRAWHIANTANNPKIIWTIQGNLCILYAKNYPDLAIWYGKQAVNTLQAVRAGNTGLDKAMQKSFLKKNEAVYKDLADLLFSQGRLMEGQEVLTMLKEAEYYDYVQRSSDIDPRKTVTSYTDEEQTWSKRYQVISGNLASIAKEYEALLKQGEAGLTAKDKARLAKLDADRTVASQAFDAFTTQLFRELGKQGGQSASAARQQEIGAKQISSLSALQGTLESLGHGAVTLHYLMTDQRLWILLTTPTVQIKREAPIGEAELNRLIGQYRQAIALHHPRIKELGKALYDILIAPVAKDLEQEKAQTLMLSLDGTLRYLPMAALYDGERYLVQRYRLALFTEATKDKLKDMPKAQWRFAGFGLTRKIENYSPLPSVKDELEGMVTSGFAGEIKLDKDFSAASLKSGLSRRPPVVHLASHFVFKTGTEADSFLLLGDGAPLSLKAIKDENFKFTDIDLVTLSACDTAVGGGKDANGREVEGFGVLVQNQGAKGVMATLWPVADESTGQFMQLFYGFRQRNPGMTKAEAMQLAQRAFIEGKVAPALTKLRGSTLRVDVPKATTTETDHPFFWAPFILMGNWL